nr:hypothetical protein [Tanacetum cinerariifolium]
LKTQLAARIPESKTVWMMSDSLKALAACSSIIEVEEIEEVAAKAFNESDIIQTVFDSGMRAASCVFNLPVWEVKNIVYRNINHHQDVASVLQNSITFLHKRLQEEEVTMIGRDSLKALAAWSSIIQVQEIEEEEEEGYERCYGME